MNLQRIQYFLVLCESFHFTNAAKKLGISQPALTKSIYQLEKDLGVRLIRREGRHTHLTKQGAVIRDKYTELVAAVGKIEADIANAIVGEAKSLKLAVAQTVDFTKFIGFLARYHSLYPNVQLDIVDCDESECEDLLLNGEVDFSLTFTRSSKDDQVQFLEVYKDQLGVMAASSVNQSDYQSLVDLTKQQLNSGRSIAHQTDRVFDATNSKPVVKVAQELWAQQLIQAGMGVGLVSSSAAALVNPVDVCWEMVQERQIYVSLIAGRFDSDAYTKFVGLLRNFNWVNQSEQLREGYSETKISTKVLANV